MNTSLTHADKLREVRRQLERPHYTGGPCDVTCPACSALAALPDPEEVELLETKVAAFGSTLQFQEKQAGQFKQQRDELAAALKDYGECLPTCAQSEHPDQLCTCGLNDIIKRHEEGS